jgi:GAF domain-containing protein
MRNDPSRLEMLRQLMVLDSAREAVYDDLASLVATSLDVPMAMVNMLDADRDWFKACIGLPMSESSATTSFCGRFFDSDVEMIVAEDTLVDKNFSTHPFVLGAPFIRFYAGARLVVQGKTVGTLCAYDTKPKKVSMAQLENLRVLAQAVVESLEARRVR